MCPATVHGQVHVQVNYYTLTMHTADVGKAVHCDFVVLPPPSPASQHPELILCCVCAQVDNTELPSQQEQAAFLDNLRLSDDESADVSMAHGVVPALYQASFASVADCPAL